MENIDEEVLIDIFQTSTNVVVSQEKYDILKKKLDFLDSHQREKITNDLIDCFRYGMSNDVDFEVFRDYVDKYFDSDTYLNKAVKAYWRKNSKNLQQLYKHYKPFENNMVDFKWVSSITTGSKYTYDKPSSTARCIFSTINNENIVFDMTKEGAEDLLEELSKIQSEIEKLR